MKARRRPKAAARSPGRPVALTQTDSPAAFVPPPPPDPVPTIPSTADPAVDAARLREDRRAAADLAKAHAELERDIARQARGPFRAMLRELVGAAPTPEAIRRFADKYPDRWAQAVSIAAGLAGYVRDVVEVNVYNVQSLSDAELLGRLATLDRQLTARRAGETVDAEVVSEGSRPPPAAGG